MDRARAANLIPGSLAGDEADQAEDFRHGDSGPNLGEANTRHGGLLRTRPEAVVARGGDVIEDGIAGREEEPVRGPRGLKEGPADAIYILTDIIG